MLYLVATPIGNLEDITLRALSILRDVDLIAAEDTRRTAKLLAHYEIHKPLVSYYEHNKMSRGPELLAKLKQGKSIALVSDAGTPGISDPGEDLVKMALDNGLEVTMAPGPVAGIMGLVLSGLSARRFVFEGFLPEEKKKRTPILDKLSKEERTVVLYESPHRLVQTLQELHLVLGERSLVVCRELTKRFEEIRKGCAEELLSFYREHPPRGEFVLVIDGFSGEQPDLLREEEPVWAPVRQWMEQGLDKNAAIRKTAEERNLPRNVVYQQYEKEKALHSGGEGRMK